LLIYLKLNRERISIACYGLFLFIYDNGVVVHNHSFRKFNKFLVMGDVIFPIYACPLTIILVSSRFPDLKFPAPLYLDGEGCDIEINPLKVHRFAFPYRIPIVHYI